MPAGTGPDNLPHRKSATLGAAAAAVTVAAARLCRDGVTGSLPGPVKLPTARSVVGESSRELTVDDFGNICAARQDLVFRVRLAAEGDRLLAEDAAAEEFARACAHRSRPRARVDLAELFFQRRVVPWHSRPSPRTSGIRQRSQGMTVDSDIPRRHARRYTSLDHLRLVTSQNGSSGNLPRRKSVLS